MPPLPYAVSDKPYVRGLVTVEKLAAKAAQQHLRAAAASEQYLRLCAEAEARGVQQALLEQYLQQQYSQQEPEQVSDEEAEQDDLVELCDGTDDSTDNDTEEKEKQRWWYTR
jgi:transcription antitermination factor NusG